MFRLHRLFSGYASSKCLVACSYKRDGGVVDSGGERVSTLCRLPNEICATDPRYCSAGPMLLLGGNNDVLLFNSKFGEVAVDGRIIVCSAHNTEVTSRPKTGDKQFEELQAGVPWFQVVCKCRG